jgi:uncharacterized membrane protein
MGAAKEKFQSTGDFGSQPAGQAGKRHKMFRRGASLGVGARKPGIREAHQMSNATVLDTKHAARIGAIDLMRGLVMLLMAVDHVRENIFAHMVISDPVDPGNTSPALFFTRLTAHLCAPTFVFLTGLGAWLYANPPGRPPRSPAGFLFKRGLLLLVLECTLVSIAWYGDLPPHTVFLQVIWAIGLSMIVLAAVSSLPLRWLGAAGLLIVFGHNAFSGVHFQPGEAGYVPWMILHDRGFLPIAGAIKWKVSYPVLPWIGVILCGFAAGPIYGAATSSERRRQLLLWLGAGSLLLLAVLRGFNIYGETLPWAPGTNLVHSAMSFLSLTKYPPSLDFLLFTLGVAFLLLRGFERLDYGNRLVGAIRTIGGAPMFFYLLHLYALLLMQTLAVRFFGANHGTRFGVEHVYTLWLTAVVLVLLLYFPVRAFANYKRRSTQAWVRYF